MTKILFINVPQISLVYPPAATSLLKGICEKNGYVAQVKDYNLQLYNSCHDQNISQELDQYFSLNNAEIVLSSGSREYLESYYQQIIQEVIDINPEFLGISVFTFQCQLFTKQFLDRIRPVFKNKIVVGGAGLASNGIAAAQNDFGNYLLDNGLVDYYIRGEGDYAILALLRGEEYPGINNDEPVQIDNLDNVPYPNYDDVVHLNYRYTTGTPQIPITGSRGCIRKCSFCDIHVAWKKYRYRSGVRVAQELIHHYEKYKVQNFWFTDSLINGSMKSFREFCQSLTEYYEKHNLPNRYFNWGGQFIVRDSHSMTKQDYTLAANAGMNGVAMGVESLSESVRDHMKKGFTDADLDFALEQMHHNNMNCYFLMIVGYPTETLENFEDGVSKFVEYQKYALDGTIYGINLGSTASIDEGTPLFYQIDELNMDPDRYNIGYNWLSLNNPTLTFRERVRRRIVLQEKLMQLGYKIWNGDSQLLKLKEAFEKINDRKYKIKITLPVAE
jgi:radical SAM superfamily enzyme YgiQ (UPF0313 family)